MSQISITGASTGTATFTIESPATSTNRTLTIPDATTTLVGTDATQTLTNKDIVATQLTGDVAAARITTALNASGSAPIFAARAWVNFNGTGTVAIRASGNVSSITDNGAGDYTVNFTTAMPDANYAPIVSSKQVSNGTQICFAVIPSESDVLAGSCRVAMNASATGGGGRANTELFAVSIFR
jgi:hypothetical protein